VCHQLEKHEKRFPFLSACYARRTVLLPARTDTVPPRGFTATSAQTEIEWEKKFSAIPDASRMREAMRRLSARPHHVGSAYGKANAEWIRDQFRSYGWDAQIENFGRFCFPTPKERVVEMIRSDAISASLRETMLPNESDFRPAGGAAFRRMSRTRQSAM
jgi:hypothetical protein